MASNIINKIQNEIALTLQRMQTINCMLRGSYGKAYRKCGKPNCRCANPAEKAHPFYRITWTEQGKSYTRNIPEIDREWVKQAVENYRTFKSGRKKLYSLHKKLDSQLAKLEKKIINLTRKQKPYF